MNQRLAACILLILGVLFVTAPAHAHGKRINIDVTTNTPDPFKPLNKFYRALLTYDDGDKVNDARLALSANRAAQNESIAPVAFAKAREDGVYQASVSYPSYGEWTLRFQVTYPGEGQTTLTETLVPPSPGEIESSRARVTIPLAFDTRDALNIGARTIHIFAAVGWFAVIVMLLVAPRVLSPQEWQETLSRSARSLPKILGVLWLLLIATGIYLAINSVPDRAPGVFAPELLLRLPWGREYFIAFLLKMFMVVGVLGVGLAIGYVLRQPNEMTRERLTRWVAIDLLLGLFIFADVVIIGYLHTFSHLGLLK